MRRIAGDSGFWVFPGVAALVAAAAWREPRLRVLLPAAAAFAAAALASRFRGASAGRPPSPKGGTTLGWLLLAGLIGVLLVALKFPVREYYYDTAEQIAIGQRTRELGFFVTHGQRSGAGVENPPLFAYVMGLLTVLTTDPEVLAATLTAVNIAAAAVLARFLAAMPPHPYGIIAAVLMATAQATVDYSVLLWEGSLLIPFACAFQAFLWRLLRGGGQRDFLGLAVAAGLSAQCHQSGMLLYPLLAVIAVSQRRRIGKRALLASIGIVLALSAPYLHYLFREGGLEKLAHFVHEGKRISVGKLLNVNAGMASTFFTYYPFYRLDLRAFLSRAAGPAAWPLYLASLVAAVAFFAGWAAYLGWAISRRRVFSDREEDTVFFPIPFQAAGFTLTGLTLLYMVSARYIWYKHFLVAFPAHALLASWAIWRLWGSRAARLLFAAAIAAGVIVTAGIYREIARAGGTLANGTINAYRLGYASYKTIRDEVWGAVAPGHAPRLFFDGVWTRSLRTVVFPGERHHALPRESVLLDVRWDAVGERFTWVVAPVQGAVERHALALRRVAGMLPAGATVAGTEPAIHALNPEEGVEYLGALLPPGTRWTRYRPQSGEADADWVVIDSADPRVLVPAPGAEVWDLLVEGPFGLVAAEEGLFVFRRGADPAAGRDLLERRGLPFREFLVHGRDGTLAADPEAAYGLAWRFQEGTAARGTLLDLPLPRLQPGRYEAVIRSRGAKGVSRPALAISVATAAGRNLKELEIDPPSSPGAGWADTALGFTIAGEAETAARLLVVAQGPGEVWLDAPRLRLLER